MGLSIPAPVTAVTAGLTFAMRFGLARGRNGSGVRESFRTGAGLVGVACRLASPLKLTFSCRGGVLRNGLAGSPALIVVLLPVLEPRPRFIIRPNTPTSSAASSNISSSIPSVALYTSAIVPFANCRDRSCSLQQSYRKAQYSVLTLSRNGCEPHSNDSASVFAASNALVARGM